MSRTEINVVRMNGDVEFHMGIKNSWLGAMFIWEKLSDKHSLYQASLLPDDPGIGFHFGKAMFDEFKSLFGYVPYMNERDRLIMESTCDAAIVPIEMIPTYIAALKSFADQYPGGSQSLLADILEKLPSDIRGICFRQTSVAEDPWVIYPDDDEEVEGRPYNIYQDTITATGSKHWFVDSVEA